MFCDLVGSTALSTRLDPEDLREVIAAYHACATEVVTRFGGYVAKYMGDGVLVYFGYPEASETDAENAVRAALALIDAVGRLSVGGVRHEARIGLATGLVVVGELVGAGEAQERNVVGETPNLAARLQSAAAPNTVVVAATTRRLAGELFEYAAIEPAKLKGFEEPISAWRVLRERTVASRFEAFRAATQTPLVGREEEIELLRRRWQQIKEGEGRVVLLAGEPGIGKSRLTRRWRITSRTMRIRACATSASRITRAARCSRFWRSLRTPRASPTTTMRRPNSRSLTGCWRGMRETGRRRVSCSPSFWDWPRLPDCNWPRETRKRGGARFWRR